VIDILSKLQKESNDKQKSVTIAILESTKKILGKTVKACKHKRRTSDSNDEWNTAIAAAERLLTGFKEAAHKETKQSASKKSAGDTSASEKVGLSSSTSSGQPDAVGSSSAAAYDEGDYASLHQRYLMPRIREKAELAGGITLRRQCKARVIDQKTRGFRLLKSKVDALLRKKDHGEVYRLLCQLRNWELDPQRVPAVFQDRSSGDDDVAEVLDLTTEEDRSGNHCIDVDEYITDVLLVGVKREGNGMVSPLKTPSSSLPEHAPSSHHQSRQVPLSPSNSEDFQEATTCKDSTSQDSHVEEEPPNLVNCNNRSPPATPKVTAHQVHITCAGLEEVETYAYAVIANVIQESGLCDDSGGDCISVNMLSSISPDAVSSAVEPINDLQANPKQIQSLQDTAQSDSLLEQSSHKNYGSQRSGASGEVLWDDIPKPPGQLTIDECRDFYASRELIEEPHREFSDKLASSATTVGPARHHDVDSNQVRSPLNTSQNAPVIICQQSTTKSSTSRGSSAYGESDWNSGKQVLWDDIPKPPGQRTIDECRDFYARAVSIGRPRYENSGKIAPSTKDLAERLFESPPHSYGLHGQQQNLPTHTACVLDQQANLLLSRLNALPPLMPRQLPDNISQVFLHRMTAQTNAALTLARMTLPPMVHAQTKDTISQNELICPPTPAYQTQAAVPLMARRSVTLDLNKNTASLDNYVVPEKKRKRGGPLDEQGGDHKAPKVARASRVCRVVGCSKYIQQGGVCVSHGAKVKRYRARKKEKSPDPTFPKAANKTGEQYQMMQEQRVGPQSYPILLSPKEESLVSDMQPSTPTHEKKKPPVARLVTPEIPSEMNTPAPVLKRKSRRTKKRMNINLDEKMRRKLHFTQMKTSRFSFADFGFPSNQKMLETCGSRSSPSTGTVDSKMEERLRKRSPAQYKPTMEQQRLQHVKAAIHVPTFSVIPSSRIVAIGNKSKDHSKLSLHEDWKKQTGRRRKGQWIPNGHLTGRWKPPPWAGGEAKNGCLTNDSKPKKYPGCRKSLLPKLNSLLSTFMDEAEIKCDLNGESLSLNTLYGVCCPQYVKPTFGLLRSAHTALKNLLPKGDCEEWEVVQLARRYYNAWRPKETKVILLAESHAFTSKERALHGAGLDEGILHDTYFGPREFLSLVYCLSYGENESLSGQANDKTNKGTPQFWALLAACARGVDHVAKTNTKSTKSFSSLFAADLLKGGNLPVEQRLEAKLQVLEDLRRRGIWLLDASLFGWYISQPQEYSRSSISNEVHRKAKSRPPKELKIPSLVLSWELFTKHLIRDVAEEGNLKLLIPIGMEVEAALTRERMEDAISSGTSEARLSDTFPAPNAWIPGGYGPFHAKLAALVNEAAPVARVKIDEAALVNEAPAIARVKVDEHSALVNEVAPIDRVKMDEV
ncbi:hypothetical protein ACHAXR_012463, partial [Thalassiosira sp. AJA248-18]